jgi:hypothetical protein
MQIMSQRRVIFLAAAGAIGCVLFCASAGAQQTAMSIQQDNTSARVVLNGQPVLVYRFAGVPKKPYASELLTPGGVNVLRDSPADHKHHHALMFAVGVDGINFWEENNACGLQESRSIAGTATSTQPGGSQAHLIQELAWVGPKADKPLLVEHRTVGVGRTKDGKATLLTWQTRLEPPSGKPQATLGGSHYFGLGMRFLISMDQNGRFFTPENKEGEIVRGTERLTPVRWMAYTASADGKPVTVAMFDHPSNPRHPARFFTMSKPFSYLAATMNLWKEPLVIEAGKPLALCYGVAVWDGEVDTAKVDAAYQEWLAEAKPAKP